MLFEGPNNECDDACQASLTALGSVGRATSFLGLYRSLSGN